ncbi:MAG: MotA/TolQ/ExbB proton channel family protein [Fibrobacterota bacterium]
MPDIPALSTFKMAGPVGTAIIALLICLSGLSWAVIIIKLLRFRKNRKKNSAFLKTFGEKLKLKDFRPVSPLSSAAPFERVAGAACAEYRRLLDSLMKAENIGDGSFFLENHFTIITDAANSAMASESDMNERHLFLLAVTSTVAPFMGLLGTVWGIMNSFSSIGASGSASLAVVAPGIAAALSTTISGLIVAIPAVVAFNYYTYRNDRFDTEMDEFSSSVLNRIKREMLDIIYRTGS